MKPSVMLAAYGWLNAAGVVWGVLLGWIERGTLTATALIVFLLIGLMASAVASPRRQNVSKPEIRRVS